MSIIAPEYFTHFSNILLLVAYSVRDILWLRCFAVAAALINIPYFLLQQNVLWPPVMWAIVFMIINSFQIVRILWERRPVVLTAEERALYDLGFHALKPRDFVSLITVGRWQNAAAGDTFLTEGKPVEAIGIAISGTIQLRRKTRTLGDLKPGRVVGTTSALLGQPSLVDAVFVEPARYIRWSVADIQVFLDKKPELRATLERLAHHDLALQAYQFVSAGDGVPPDVSTIVSTSTLIVESSHAAEIGAAKAVSA